MSTIAYRDGMLSCDTLVTDDAGWHQGLSEKIWQLPDGSLYGGVGSHADILRVKAWIIEGMQPEARPEVENYHGIIVRQDGSWNLLEAGLEPVIYQAEYVAIGSGRSVALGALHHGATAAEAIEAARQHDVSTGGTVYTLELKSARKPKRRPSLG